MSVAVHPFPLVDHLTTGTPFAFSRFGDGEWSAILGHGHHNCDGQAYTARLRADLANVLRARPDYQIALQALALRRFGPDIEAWLDREGLSDLEWVRSDTLHRASARDEFGPVLTALRRRGVVLIGPRRLASIPVRVVGHVIVPARNAYDVIEHLRREILAAAGLLGSGPVYALSAGLGAGVLIHHAHKAYPEHTWVDFGSVWEPYVGHANRTYHRAVLEREQAKAARGAAA